MRRFEHACSNKGNGLVSGHLRVDGRERGVARDTKMREQVCEEVHAHLSPRFHQRECDPRDTKPVGATGPKVDLLVIGKLGRTRIPEWLTRNIADVIRNNLQPHVLDMDPAGFDTRVSPD